MTARPLPTNARKSFGDIAPKLAELSDEVLFGESLSSWLHTSPSTPGGPTPCRQ